MTLDVKSAVTKGRSWRDLPPKPPYGDPLHPVAPVAPPPSSGAPEPARSRHSSRWWLLALISLGVIVLLLLWSPWSGGADEAAGSPATTTTLALAAPPPTLATSDEPIADVADALLPSLVNIQVPGGVGSGFIYDSSGLIFTAAHVVENQSQVDVRLADGREFVASVLGADADRDVAVLEIDATGLTPAALATDDTVVVGQTAVAFGSPFGLSETVTAGVVSALDQSLDVGRRTISGLIQTDAPINPGNSGGPLVDLTGRVVGINVAIYSTSGGNDGLGFAVPIDTALQVARQLLEDGPQSAVAPSTSVPSDELSALLERIPGLDQFAFPFSLDPGGSLGMLDGELQQLLDELLRSGTSPAPDGRPTMTLTTVPEGFGIRSVRSSSTGGDRVETITLSGGRGTIFVIMWTGTIGRLPPGEAMWVRGHEGSVSSDGGTTVLAWQEAADMAFEIQATDSVRIDELVALAEGLEVTR